MKAMLLEKVSDLTVESEPLRLAQLADPVPVAGEVRIKVSVCAVCHTELDEIEGRTPPPRYPVVPGHQVVGVVDRVAAGVTRHRPGDRVGVGWIFSACGECEYCLRGDENLCPAFAATGRDHHGGYADYMCIPEDFALAIPQGLSDVHAAPLFCAGAIGYRSLRLAAIADGDWLGLTGFGASAHLVLKMVRQELPNCRVCVFARSEAERQFARDLGAIWAGATEDSPPHGLHAIIDTTPAWLPIVAAMKCLLPGGRLVINAIRKEARDQDILLSLDYPSHLWMEKEIKSVANVTRRDIEGFLALAARIPLEPETQLFALEDANRALLELKRGQIRGAKVLTLQ